MKKAKWFTKKTNGHYYCLMCRFESNSFLGITSHVRKHRRERERMGVGQKTLDGKTIV